MTDVEKIFFGPKFFLTPGHPHDPAPARPSRRVSDPPGPRVSKNLSFPEGDLRFYLHFTKEPSPARPGPEWAPAGSPVDAAFLRKSWIFLVFANSTSQGHPKFSSRIRKRRLGHPQGTLGNTGSCFWCAFLRPRPGRSPKSWSKTPKIIPPFPPPPALLK